MNNLKLAIYTLLVSTLVFSACKKDVEGCTDKNSNNYNPDATINTGCVYKGCTDPKAENYNPQATISGDCIYKGCTDKEAENYDAKATISGDCIFSRDKFIGKYDGTIACANTLSLLSGTTTFTIDEDITGGKNSVTVLITTTTGLIVPVKGICKDKVLSIDAQVKDVTVTVSGLALKADIKAKGDVTYDEAKKEISGPLALDVTNPLIGTLSDNCPFFGKKK